MNIDLLKKTAHGAKALADAAANPQVWASLDVIQSRRDECHRCDQNDFGFCAVCKCFLRAKTKLVYESCPLPEPKWGAVGPIPSECRATEDATPAATNISPRVIVTGMPRSGTSLMMQTLQRLGIDPAGDEFPQAKRFREQIAEAEADNDPQRVAMLREQWKRAEELNPGGFYEVGGTVVSGGVSPAVAEAINGKALKVITRGIMRLPSVFPTIVCLREPLHIAISTRNMQRRAAPIIPGTYMRDMAPFAEWLLRLSGQDFAKLLPVQYRDMLTTPEREAERIAAHLGIELTPEARAAVVLNVSPDLSRSDKTTTTWAKNSKRQVIAAVDALYAAFSVWDRAAIEAALEMVQECPTCGKAQRRQNGVPVIEDHKSSQ